VATVDRLIKPEGFRIDEASESFDINGLTQMKLDAEGVPVKEVLDEYVKIIDDGYVLVAYNAQHDMKQMRAELRRAGMDDRFENSPNICLMRLCGSKAVGVVKPDGGRGWPKLVHAAEHFGIQMGKQHEGLSDAAAAFKIFAALRARDLLPDAEGKVHHAKDRPLRVGKTNGQMKMDF
jgi:DNA polymerase-3 subunit epsilon